MSSEWDVAGVTGGDSSAAVSGHPQCLASSPLVSFLLVVLVSVTRKRQAEHTRAAWAAWDANSAAAARGEPADNDGTGATTTRTAGTTEHVHDAVQHYDYVVVGGGTAGSVVAARLAEDANCTVLVLERGGREPQATRVPGLTITLLSSPLAEQFLTQPERHNCNGTGCVVYDHNVLGGGSTLNSMMYVRGSARVYDRWAELTGDDRWSYRRVLPYFKKAEDNLDPAIRRDTKHHGTGGPQKVSWPHYHHPVVGPLTQALQDAGLPSRVEVNADNPTGYTILQLTQALGERWSTSRGYLQPATALWPDNLHVKTYSTARRVVLEHVRREKGDEGKGEGEDKQPRAVGVEYKDAAGKTHVVRAHQEVVLSAGALHTPQLLMLSGIGPADHLEELGIEVAVDQPAVGRNLQDHPAVQGVQYACGPPLCDTDWASRRFDLHVYGASRAGPLSVPGLQALSAFTKSHGEGREADDDKDDVPDLQIMFFSSTVPGEGCPDVQESWRLNRVSPIIIAVQPRSRGHLRLDAIDPHEQPLVSPNYFAEQRDLDVVVEGLRLALSLNETLAKHGLFLNENFVPECDSHRFASQAYLRCVSRARTGASQHWAGSCRMGRDDHGDHEDDDDDDGYHHHDEANNRKKKRKDSKKTSSVLDSRLRVRGVPGLRVADASAMPALPSGNTMAPTVMLAEVAADLIKQDYNHHVHDDDDKKALLTPSEDVGRQ